MLSWIIREFMGVDAYQTYQTSRTTFSAALSAALGQVSSKYQVCRCRPKKNQIIP